MADFLKNRKSHGFISLMLSVLFIISAFAFTSVSVSAQEEEEIKTFGSFNYKVIDDAAYIVEYVGDGGDVAIPDTIDGMTVVGILDEAFWSRSDITAVSLPQSLETLGMRAFQGCSSLKEITLPDSVYGIDDACFCDCTSLASVNLPDDIYYVGAFAFDNTPWINRYSENTSIIFGGRIFYKYQGDAQTVVIPKGVSSISSNAFAFCEKLSYVSIPETVTMIGNYAFYNCPNLKSISLPLSLVMIGDSAPFGYHNAADAAEPLLYEDFVLYSEDTYENGEATAAAQYSQVTGIPLISPSKHATPDELPMAEVCIPDDSLINNDSNEDSQTGGTFNKNGMTTLIIIVASCLVVIGGIYLVLMLADKKNKNAKKQTAAASKGKKKKK